jgi:uncharacterized integral membrane protein
LEQAGGVAIRGVFAIARASNGRRMAFLKSLEERLPWAVRNGRPTWVVKYSGLCIVLLALVVVIFQHWLGLDVLSYTDPIGIAALLGLITVILIGVALMGATFYSARSGMDEQVGDARDLDREDNPRE